MTFEALSDSMKKESTNMTAFEKIYLWTWLGCLFVFFLPAAKLTIGSQIFFQYPFKTYPGQVAFGIVFLLGLFQCFFFYRRKKMLSWPGLISGLYVLGFAVNIYPRPLATGRTDGIVSLAVSLPATSSPMPGIWLLAICGITFFALSITKKVSKQ